MFIQSFIRAGNCFVFRPFSFSGQHMHPIPFVKSSSTTTTTTEQGIVNTNTNANPPSTTDDTDLGTMVAGIYESIVSSTSSSSATKDHDSSSSSIWTAGDSTSALDHVNSKSSIYCPSCDLVVRDPAHFHGTAHLVSVQSRPPPQRQQQQQQHEEAQGQKQMLEQQQQQQQKDTPAAVTRLELEYGKERAVQLMKKQGWRYGQGLGKTNQGAPYPVTTVWKQDRLGIGHPRTDRRRITHPSISKAKDTKSSKNMLKNPGLVSGKKLAADAKAEANLRTAMLHYMNH
ncbi:hypothetical protein BCR42DRAFT_425087 [Absidia repens]|uniref:G-patch domain-containing protein n=1 Tax=Absidia repens TaxID=90262 RepID=A0A1X2I3D0_9FUNG|nr:hypothetical protein BCR42DRAFT_425087 [Absidia repens]